MSNGTLIVLKKNGSEGSRFIIEEDNVYKIGSGFDCHLRFNIAKDVSANVCTISTKKKGTVKLKKMSTYPILVNNKEISSPKNLKTGDVINIGSKIFRWDSEMTKSESTVTSSQKKITSSGSIRLPFAPIRTRRRSSIMKIRKNLTAENLRPWQETSESIVSSKADTDNAKFTVSASPVKVSSAADCIVQSDKQHKLRSSRGATNTTTTTADMRTPKVTGKTRTLSKIPIACTDTMQSVDSNEQVKTPVLACSPLKTPNIKAIKSASKKSASIKKSSDCIMQAKKWKISDISDDTAKSSSPELFDIDNGDNENDANVSSDTLSTSNASFSKQEETPKLRNASTNKKFITNKSHTELKKVIKKLRRGSLPTEADVDSPVINKLMISAKTVATDDLSALSQSDLSTRRSLQKKINQSHIDPPNTSSEEPAVRRSTRKQNSLSPPSDANQSDLMKDDQLNTSQQHVSPPNRRSLRMENRLSSVQLNSSFNKSNNQSIIEQSDSPLRKSLHKEQRNSSVKKSATKETGSQSDFENSPQSRQSLRQNNLNNSSVKKHGDEVQLNISQSEVFGTRKSLRKEMQLHDISQCDLSVTESVQNVNLLDISQPESSRSTRNDNVSTRKSRRKNNLLDITVDNPSPRISMRKSSNVFNISQNISGVGFLNDDNDLIEWDSPDIEQNNVTEPESPDRNANENEDLIDFEDQNNAVASAKKARKVLKSPLNDLSDIRGVKTLMKTPGRAPKTPKNDLTDVRGVKQLLDPKKHKSPKNDLTNVAGVKALLETPGRKGKTPKNDLTNVHGVKRLMNPFREPQSPENDLTKVWGCKQLLTTPKIQKSPLNNLTDVKGIRNLLKTPGREVKSPKNDLSDVRGIKRLMNPFKDPKSPENDLSEVAGVKSLFRTPKVQNSPNNDLTSVKGVKALLKTPARKQNSPENDLRDVRGVKQLLDPKLVKSPENDLSDIRGVKQLFKRNNMPRNDLTDVEDVRHLFVTPEKTLNKPVEVEEGNKPTRVSSMDDIFNELKYENEPTDSPLSHLRKSPMKTYERKAMSLSPMKRDVDNVKLKTRYSERIIQGPSAHVQKWIEEQTVLSSTRDDENQVDKRSLPVEPEVSEPQSKLINQGVLRTKNLDDVENTSDADMTPRTRTRRQRIKALEDTKTASPLNQSGHGKTEPLSVEGITKIVPEQDVPLKRRGRPKLTTTNVTDIETVTSTRTRRGRGKDTAEDEVEQVVLIQKTTRRLRNNEKTTVETVEVIQNNTIEDVNILHSLGITENEKMKNSRKRTKADTDLDIGENKSSKRQRKEDTSLHVKFDIPDVSTPIEPKRTRRGTKKTETKTDENETKPTVRRGRNTRRKESDENENDSEIIEVATPETTTVQVDTNLPVKRGRNTRKKEQDESKENVEENEPQPTQKRGRNTRKKQVTEVEIIVVSDENVEENTVKPRRKQPAKKNVVETDENDINAINVPAKPVRRTRAAKVIMENKKTEDSEEENSGKKIQRKRRSPYTDSAADENTEENIDSSMKTKRRKANDKVAEQEDVNLSAKSTKRTRVNVIKEQEEPVRKSTRTRKAKC